MIYIGEENEGIKLGDGNVAAIYLGDYRVYPATENPAVRLTSTSTLTVGMETHFEMEVTSITEPVFINVEGGVLDIVESSPNVWTVTSVSNITRYGFDYNDQNNKDNITAINIISNESVTSLENCCMLLQSLESWTWNGAFNVTEISALFFECASLLTITPVDFSAITDFGSVFGGCSSLTYVPVMDTSNGTNFGGMLTRCASLILAPELNLSSGIQFSNMFSGCELLTYIPVLNTPLGEEFIYMFSACTQLKCIGGIDTRNQTYTTNMFNLCTSLVNPTSGERATIEAGALYVNPNPCPDTELLDAPIYELTEPLGGALGQYWVENSSSSGNIHDGLLEHKTSSSPTGTPWSPIVNPENYYDPETSTIVLVVAGDGTRQINTQWIAPATSTWSLIAIYNVDLGVSYDMYAIDYHGDNTCDVYLYSSGTGDFPTTPTYAGIAYTPPTAPWLIYETAPNVIFVDEIEYTMGIFNIE